MLLTQPPLTSPRGRKNVANSPSSKFKCVKPSMMSATVDHDKVNADILNKTKDELRELTSKFNPTCSSTNDDCSISNWNSLVSEKNNSLASPTFMQNFTKGVINECSRVLNNY